MLFSLWFMKKLKVILEILNSLIKLSYFAGKDCSVNINECESNPCVGGSTCKDEIATFSCICPPGLTGRLCETNIDDCEVIIIFWRKIHSCLFYLLTKIKPK